MSEEILMDYETVWTKLEKLQSQDVINSLRLIYGNLRMDMEIRQELAPWLEKTLTETMNFPVDHPRYEEMTQTFKEQFLTNILLKSRELQGMPQIARFQAAAKNYQYMNSVELFSRHVDIFKKECALLRDYESGNYTNYVSASRKVDENIEKLQKELSEFEIILLMSWRNNFENYQSALGINQSSANGYESPSHTVLQDLTMSSANLCYKNLIKLAPQMTEILKNFGEKCDIVIRNVIDNYIKQWKFSQMKYGNNDFNIQGADLEKLQSWCSTLAQMLLKSQEMIDLIQENRSQIENCNDSLSGILMMVKQSSQVSLINLIRGSIIIESQPPQVIKTNTKFTSTIRLLVGSALSSKINNASVTASIISEFQARSALSNKEEMSCGDLVNFVTKLESNENSMQLVGNFRSLLLKNFKRVGKKTNDLVTDEKFGIIFKIQLTINGLEVKEKILSSPIVVIVHGSQETNALATIFWDNAFALYDRQNFVVTDNVKWIDFATALNYKFYSATGRALTDENLHFLAEKFYGHSISQITDDLMVTYSDFTKEKLKDREFTFWEWLHAAFKLTTDFLRNSWNDNCIIGFIDKKRAEDLLKECVHGTFILRFSDSELGALSIAWVNRQGVSLPEVIHIQPTKYKEFETTTLAKRIHQIEDLLFLYPQIPKFDAFRLEETPLWSASNYIRCITVMRVQMRGSSSWALNNNSMQ